MAHSLVPTDTATVSLFNRREALLKRITAWYTRGSSLFTDIDLADLTESSGGTDEPCVCEEDIPCYCPHREDGKSLQISMHRAESMVLPLPSSVRPLPKEWEILVPREAALRVAHAHESLEELRKIPRDHNCRPHRLSIRKHR